jgi:hypothetical protein
MHHSRRGCRYRRQSRRRHSCGTGGDGIVEREYSFVHQLQDDRGSEGFGDAVDAKPIVWFHGFLRFEIGDTGRADKNGFTRLGHRHCETRNARGNCLRKDCVEVDRDG